MRFHLHGREVYADTPTALGAQLWLQTWVAIHADQIRPGAAVLAKATIPEETYAGDPTDPNPYGLTGRAEVNFDMVLEGSDPDQIQALGNGVIAQMSSNEVMGWVGMEETS